MQQVYNVVLFYTSGKFGRTSRGRVLITGE
jgi:hypothetical protein